MCLLNYIGVRSLNLPLFLHTASSTDADNVPNFQYTIFYSCPTRRHKRFYQGRSIKASENRFFKLTFEENMKNFEKRLLNRGYSASVVEKHLSEVKLSDRKASLKLKNRDAGTRILPLVTQYHPALPNLNEEWHLIQNQSQLREIFTEPPTISYRKRKSLVRAKL